MTYEQWLSTERRHQDFAVVANAFGYIPKGCAEVIEYAAGVIVLLGDGFYFSHVGRDEYTGSLDEVRLALWQSHAAGECGE